MSNDSAFLIGPGGQIQTITGPRGETPACPAATFSRGAVVKIRNTKALKHFPREAIVAVAIPPGFSPDHAFADLVGQPRPLMAVVGSRHIKYILVRDDYPKAYLVRESDLLPSGKPPVEIGTVRMSDDPQ